MRSLQINIPTAESGILTPIRINALHRILRLHILYGRHPPPAATGQDAPSVVRETPALSMLAFQPGPSYRVPHAKDEDKVRSDLQHELHIPRHTTREDAMLEPDVMFSTHRRAVYRGPGHLALWPVLDTTSPTLSKLRDEDDAEKALANAAIEFLHRVYGVRDLGKVTHRPGLGLWVDSKYFRQPRQVAEIEVYPRVTELGEGTGEKADSGVISCRVDINLNSPVSGSSKADNPWARLEDMGLGAQDTTSVAAELSVSNKRRLKESTVTESKMKYMGEILAAQLGLEKPVLAGSPEKAFGENWRQMGYKEPVEAPSKISWLADTLTLGVASAFFGFFD